MYRPRRPSYAPPVSLNRDFHVPPTSVPSCWPASLNSLALVVTAQGANGRGGSKDDFLVNTITVGNASSPSTAWIQPDGATMPYLFMDESVEITVEVRRLGNAQLGKSAPVTLEVVHPIGYVMQTWSWNTSELLGSIGSDSASVVWTPDVAHSNPEHVHE